MGELVVEAGLSALVRRDGLQSKVGLYFVKEECCRLSGAGGGVYNGSGGSSKSATASSSALVAGGDEPWMSEATTACRPRPS